MGAQRAFTIKQQPEDGAVVVQRRRISQCVGVSCRRLAEREIAAIHDAARRSTTWR
jgi:hypothetical protein